MSAPRKIMLITGASGGIGADLARLAGRKGHDLALVARNGAALEALADEIAAIPGRNAPRPLVFVCDLATPGGPAAVEAFLGEAGAVPEIVVNNAGYGLLGPAAEGDLAEELGIVDLNVRALTELSLRFAKPLIANKGRLLNVASVAAYMPGPGMAVYYASKAYVLSFSEALSKELEPHGVTVTALCPGPVPTGFGDRAGFGGVMNWMKFIHVSSPVVAEAAYDAMMEGKRVVIPGLLAKIMVWSSAVTPKALMLANVAALQLRRKKEGARE
jgi:short-subunit dehydrogenase